MNVQELYKQKHGSVDEALNMIKPGEFISVAYYACEPTMLLSRLHEVIDRVPDITVGPQGICGPYPYVSLEYARKAHMGTTFHSANTRVLGDAGACDYTPANLHHAGAMDTRTDKYTFYAATVSPMDENGNFCFGVDAEVVPESLSRAKTIVLEVNPYVPFIPDGQLINIKDVDMVYESDRPMPVPPIPPITDVERTIADNVLSLINDGDTIQLGIGAMPNAVGEGLLTKNDLGIYTEMMTASMGKLMKAGVVTNKYKNLHKGKSVTSFIYGDNELYEYVNGREDIMMRPCAYVNNPFTIMQNDNLVSVNTCIQVDFTGQICSESIGYRQFSGTGGAFDFAYGAFHSKGGRGIMALSSTAKHGTISKIAPMLDPGAVVSIPRNIADYIVTEYGIARLKDRPVRERVEQLIAIAHPDFREELRKEARKMLYI